MNILMCTTFLHGGAGKVVCDLSCSLLNRGHKVFVFASKTTYPGYEHYEKYLEDLRRQHVSIILCDSTFKRDIYQNINASMALRQLLIKEDIDVIHSHAAVPSMVAMIARSGLNRYIPILQTMHGWGMNKTMEQEKMDVFLLDCVDQVIAVSKGDYILLRSLGVQNPNMRVLYNGICECLNCEYEYDDPDWQKLISLRQSGVKIIGCIGTIGKRKNQALLVDALNKIPSDCGKIMAVFLGEGDIEMLRQLADELGIRGSVVFTGYKKEASHFLKLMDMLVLPSVSEGLPLSLVEGMREKVIRVGSNIPGINEVIADGETGFLFPSGDADSLARVLIHVLEMDDAEKKRIIDKAYADFKARFTLDKMISCHLDLYNEMLNRRI